MAPLLAHRACRPCYLGGSKCSREFPFCDRCSQQGKSALCVYEARVRLRRCRPCTEADVPCSRDMPPCQACIKCRKPELCKYPDQSERSLARGRKRGRSPDTKDPPTQSEELSNNATETRQDCSRAIQPIQPAFQRTDSECPDVDIAPSQWERGEEETLPEDRYHLDITTEVDSEVDNGHPHILTNTILSDTEGTRPYFQMTFPVKKSDSKRF